MACSEITQVVQWAQSSTATAQHPVTAYFTKHYGYSAKYTATTQLAAGKALAAGGEDADVSVVKSTETYDLNLGTWLVGPDMPTPRTTHTATPVGNGKVLVAGGFLIGTTLVDTLLYAP